MKYRSFLLLCLQWCLTIHLLAQSSSADQRRTDSLRVLAMLDSADHAAKYNIPGTGTLHARSLALSQKLNSAFLQSQCFYSLANAQRKIITPLLFIYDSISLAYARKTASDSLIITRLVQSSVDYSSINLSDQAVKFNDEAFSLVQKNGSPRLLLLTSYAEGFYLFKQFQFPEAEAQFEKAMGYATVLKDEYWIALLKRIGYHAAVSSQRRDINNSGIFESLYYFRERDPLEMANCLFAIGQANRITGNMDMAAAYFFQAATVYAKQGYPMQTALSYLFIAENHLKRKEYPQAKHIVGLSDKIYSSLHYTTGQLLCYLNFARIYGAMDDIKTSDYYFSKVDSVNKQQPNETMELLRLGYLVERKVKDGSILTDEVLVDTVGRKMINFLTGGTLKNMVARVYDNGLLSIEEANDLNNIILTGHADTAIWNRKRDLKGLNPYTANEPQFDSTYQALFSRSMIEMAIKYGVQLKDDSLRLADEILEKTKLASRLKVNRGNWIIAIISAGALFTGILLYRVRKEKSAIKLQKEDADHRVGNTLQNVQVQIRKVKKISDDKPSFAQLEKRMQPMIRLYQRLEETKTGETNVQEFFKDICEDLKEFYSPSTDISIRVDASVSMEGKKADNAGFIVNELVTNSFKHAFAGKKSGSIDVICKKDKRGKYSLIVADDGKGIQSINNDDSRKGLTQVRKFAKQLSATVKENNESGTRFEFYFM